MVKIGNSPQFLAQPRNCLLVSFSDNSLAMMAFSLVTSLCSPSDFCMISNLDVIIYDHFGFFYLQVLEALLKSVSSKNEKMWWISSLWKKQKRKKGTFSFIRNVFFFFLEMIPFLWLNKIKLTALLVPTKITLIVSSLNEKRIHLLKLCCPVKKKWGTSKKGHAYF